MTLRKHIGDLPLIDVGDVTPDAVVEIETGGSSRKIKLSQIRGFVAPTGIPNLDGIEGQIADAQAQIETLFNTFDQTVSAADAATAAINASLAATGQKGIATQMAQYAVAAKDGSEAAQVSAEAAQSAAETARTAAQASAIAADGSASAAAGSASVATTKANDASNSASAAEASVVSAASQAADAASHATAAASSASSAGTAASNAASSASAAATQATEAATQAANASTSAGQASTAATNAAGSASSAATQATNAANSAGAAGTSASAASTSASSASTSASDAATAATSAASSATNAAVSAGNASTSASTSSSQASIATGAAAAAQASQNITATLAYRSIPKNPGFAAWTNGALAPDSWSQWSLAAGTTRSRVTSPKGGYGCRFTTTGSAQVGILQGPGESLTMGVGTHVAGWYVIEAEVKLNSGQLYGAGVLVTFADSSGNGLEDPRINFATDPDSSGGVVGAGTAGRTYRFSKLVRVTNAGATQGYIYAMGQWAGFGSSAAKDIEFYLVSDRAATPEEIARQTVLAPLEATVASQASTLVTLNTQFASLNTTVSAQGVTITSQTTALSSLSGNVSTLFGRASVKVDVGGRIIGWEINNNGSSGEARFHVDHFIVDNPAGDGFEYSGGNLRVRNSSGGLLVQMGKWSS